MSPVRYLMHGPDPVDSVDTNGVADSGWASSSSTWPRISSRTRRKTLMGGGSESSSPGNRVPGKHGQTSPRPTVSGFAAGRAGPRRDHDKVAHPAGPAGPAR